MTKFERRRNRIRAVRVARNSISIPGKREYSPRISILLSRIPTPRPPPSAFPPPPSSKKSPTSSPPPNSPKSPPVPPPLRNKLHLLIPLRASGVSGAEVDSERRGRFRSDVVWEGKELIDSALARMRSTLSISEVLRGERGRTGCHGCSMKARDEPGFFANFASNSSPPPKLSHLPPAERPTERKARRAKNKFLGCRKSAIRFSESHLGPTRAQSRRNSRMIERKERHKIGCSHSASPFFLRQNVTYWHSYALLLAA